jgi:hypothetical protein
VREREGAGAFTVWAYAAWSAPPGWLGELISASCIAGYTAARRMRLQRGERVDQDDHYGLAKRMERVRALSGVWNVRSTARAGVSPGS